MFCCSRYSNQDNNIIGHSGCSNVLLIIFHTDECKYGCQKDIKQFEVGGSFSEQAPGDL